MNQSQPKLEPVNLIPVTAGPLALMFDRRHAWLRYVRFGNEEIVRGLFAAVRDHNWNTVPFEIDALDIQQTSAAFTIRFVAHSQDSCINFRWMGLITGDAQGTVGYRFHGVAGAAFERNRIGLCILHPAQCAGQACRVEHIDGTISAGVFPKFISPHQPFRNIRTIAHTLGQGVEARVSMSGETFEMEDQRNWTDASYKTYSTPLSLPFPVRIEAGTEIQQSVTIEVVGAPTTPNVTRAGQPATTARLEIDWNDRRTRPPLGFQWTAGNAVVSSGAVSSGAVSSGAVSSGAVTRIKQLNPDHLRVDVWIGTVGWAQELATQIELAGILGCRLEVALFATGLEEASWLECMQMLCQSPHLARLLLFHTTEKTTPAHWAQQAAIQLRGAHPQLAIVVGTDAYFAELNRGRPEPLPSGLVGYSINPQVHAFDNESLSETLAAQAATVDSALEYFQRPVVISPLTLRPRYNPNATAAVERAAELEAAIDPRQTTGFGAAWTVGAMAALLTHPGVASLTMYEILGPRGIMASDGTTYPMAQPIQTVLNSRWVIPCQSSHPLQIVSLATQTVNGECCLLIGNLSDQKLAVEYNNPNGAIQKIHVPAESVQILDLGRRSDA